MFTFYFLVFNNVFPLQIESSECRLRESLMKTAIIPAMTNVLQAFTKPRETQLHLNTSESACAILWALSLEGEGSDDACKLMRASILPLIKAAEDILTQGLELCVSLSSPKNITEFWH
jgi:hypothetical protein